MTFSGATVLQQGSLVTGAGNVTFHGNAIVQGTFAVSGAVFVGGSVRFYENVDFTQLTIQGTIAGPANLTVVNNLVFTNSGVIKDCTFNVAHQAVAEISGYSSGVVFVINGPKIDNATFNNYGVTALVRGSSGYDYARLESSNGALFNNHLGGTFRIVVQSAAFDPVFRNYGVIQGTSSMDVVGFGGYFENYGLMEISPGDRVDLNSGSNSSGEFRLGVNSTLTFSGATVLQQGSLVTGAGNVTFSGNTVVHGDFAVSGTVLVAGSVGFYVNPVFGDVVVQGSLALHNLDVGADKLTVTGTVSGPANITVTKYFLFASEGKIQNCTLNIAPGALGDIRGWDQQGFMFSDQHAPVLDNSTFNNYGTINWDHDGWRGYIFPAYVKIDSLNGAIFVNHAGAMFNIQPMYDTGDTTTSTFVPVFKNYGIVNVTGSIDIRVFGSFENFGEIILWNGQLNFDSFSNHGLLSIKSPGLISSSNYMQGSEGELDIDLGTLSPTSEYGRLQVSTQATLGGDLRIISNYGAVPHAGDVFNIIYMPYRSGNFSAINGLNLGNGYTLQPSFYDQGLRLTTTLHTVASNS